jgi:hypothetical protein
MPQGDQISRKTEARDTFKETAATRRMEYLYHQYQSRSTLSRTGRSHCMHSMVN